MRSLWSPNLNIFPLKTYGLLCTIQTALLCGKVFFVGRNRNNISFDIGILWEVFPLKAKVKLAIHLSIYGKMSDTRLWLNFKPHRSIYSTKKPPVCPTFRIIN